MLRKRTDAFHYIDGFAGRGTYADQPGSALRAVAALQNRSIPATVSLVEADRRNFAALEVAVQGQLGSFTEPMLACGEFAELLPAVLDHPIYKRHRSVATFAFVDPCGVSGVRMADLERLLRMPYSECLLFWNYDGLNRLLGAVEKGTCQRSDLEQFFGSGELLQAALNVASRSGDPRQRERGLLDLYLGALSPAVARFLIPFRFRAARKDKTSHYLVHCSNHPRAFAIMKDIMWRLTSDGSEAGTFQYLQDDDLGRQGALFAPTVDKARAAILAELEGGTRPVPLFTKEWIERPGDMFVERQYRDILLEMERDGLIQVIEASSDRVRPPSTRIRQGKVTIGDTLAICLTNSSQRDGEFCLT